MTSKEIDSLFESVKIDSGFDMRLIVGRFTQAYVIPKEIKDLLEDVIAEAYILGVKSKTN
jgi:hypothetical protein